MPGPGRRTLRPSQEADAIPAARNEPADDQHLRRDIGYWQLTAIGFSGVIGSGWLPGAP